MYKNVTYLQIKKKKIKIIEKYPTLSKLEIRKIFFVGTFFTSTQLWNNPI